MFMMKRLALTAVLILASSGIAGVTAADQGLPRVAFFGFQLINTSPQPTTPEETQRIRMLDDMFRQKLDASCSLPRWSPFPLSCATRSPARRNEQLQRMRARLRSRSRGRLGRLGHCAESQQPYIEH